MDSSGTVKKKLIEVGIPLEAINKESIREKSIRHGHPSTLHLWWARRPLATARAVLFAQLVDDPSAHPELYPTTEEQDTERERLHKLIEELVVWENTDNKELLAKAAEEIRKSNGGEAPAILDPFAGGGSIPLEAQRLGCEAHASDLNPVAVLINKALIEIPPLFADKPPVNPEANKLSTFSGAQGLADDIRYYGKRLREQAWERVGHLYPTVTDDNGKERTVIAWIWARTVKSPNPANPIETPLVRSWWLSKKSGREAWIEASVVDGRVQYEVRHDANGPQGTKDGTVSRTGAIALGDDTPISFSIIRDVSNKHGLDSQLLAVIAEGDNGRLYLQPSVEHHNASLTNKPDKLPVGDISNWPGRTNVVAYGLTRFSDLFTNRQLTTLTTLCELVEAVRQEVLSDALAVGLGDGVGLEAGGSGAKAYADAIAVYLALSISRLTDRCSSLSSWDTSMQKVRNLFSRQAIPMIWDYAEANPFSSSTGNYIGQVEWIARVVNKLPAYIYASVQQANASTLDYSGMVISTDPPYYDNIGYSDLSDFFYIWLRQALKDVMPITLGTMLTPKSEELVANPYRHDGKEGAKLFFVDGFNDVFRRIRQTANISIPLTVYYAYRQQDSDSEGEVSTGWYTLLDGLIRTGWEITATWPVRSELSNRMLSLGTNSLASSIVLSCRPRPELASATTRRDFISALKLELPQALNAMMQSNIAPVDLAQAAIGPGISVFSRYSRVREADGSDMSVRDALLLINATLDEVLNEQETDFDPDTRFAVKWYRSYGWSKTDSGLADQLSRSTDTSISALQRSGVFEARAGSARLISPPELAGEWDPLRDEHISIWEATVRLSAIMSKEGSDRIAELLVGVQTRINLDAVKELGFLLFHEAEKRGSSEDALLFNGLISAWNDIGDRSRAISQSVEAADALGQQRLDV